MRFSGRAESLAKAAILLVLLASVPAVAQSTISPAQLGPRSLQTVVNDVPVGGVLVLQPGVYVTNVAIEAPITIVGEPGAVLQALNYSVAVMTVRDTEGVTIRGLALQQASTGLDISNSSCSILECSINTTGIGVKIFSLGSQTAILRDCSIQGEGIGIQVLGRVTALLANCDIVRMGTGISVAGLATLVASNCTVSGCYDGIQAAISSDVLLSASRIYNNLSSGIRLTPIPSEVEALASGSLCAVGNEITGNLRWGISYSTVDSAVCETADVQVLGTRNSLTGNGFGLSCPIDLLPDGFTIAEGTE